MSKLLPFSRFFPTKHLKAGQPTFFVEKILNNLSHEGIWSDIYSMSDLMSLNQKALEDGKLTEQQLIDFNKSLCIQENMTPYAKDATIRGAGRFKVGDSFTPVVWSGRPYHSPIIRFTADIKIISVVDVALDFEKQLMMVNHHNYDSHWQRYALPNLAALDGLQTEDFKNWFRKSFEGQIICWTNAFGPIAFANHPNKRIEDKGYDYLINKGGLN